MHIGIEAERANNPHKTGVEHYAKQLIIHLAKIDSHNQYTLYLRTEPEPWFLELPSNFKIKVLPFPIFWTQLRLSWELFWHPPDVLFVPASTLPLIHPKRTVYTEHDVAWIYYPEIFTWYMRQFHRIFGWLARTFATKIISVSESTKKDLLQHYRVNPEKIVVVPHGFEKTNRDFSTLSPEVAAKLPEKYLLFLSTIQPRKNLPALITAFRHLKELHPELPHKLVVVGGAGWKAEETLAAIEANKDIVVYLGRVSDEDRWPIFNRAELFVHPSLYEGFGMWMLEAFECGVPVAVSNVSSLPEVGGDAALYFDPTIERDMQDTIMRVLNDPQLAKELVRRGYERLSIFSWDRCARETLQVLEEAGK